MNKFGRKSNAIAGISYFQQFLNYIMTTRFNDDGKLLFYNEMTGETPGHW